MSARLLALVAATAVAACNAVPDTPVATQPTGTMALLRAGDAKICADQRVTAVLAKLIRPEDVAADRIVITLSDASLEAFDKQVSRAQCRANVHADSNGGASFASSTMVFTVAPSSDDPDSFVVSAPTTPLREQLADAIAQEDAANEERDQRQAEARQRDATVKPRWLIGRWVEAGSGADACATGPYLEFGADRRMTVARAEGTWSLNGLSIDYDVGDGPQSMEIATASPDGMSVADGGMPGFFRRCSRAEITGNTNDDGESGSEYMWSNSTASDDPR